MNRQKARDRGVPGEQFRAINSAFLPRLQGAEGGRCHRTQAEDPRDPGSLRGSEEYARSAGREGHQPGALGSHFQGPTAIAYHAKDVIALAKVAERGHESQPARSVQGCSDRRQSGSARPRCRHLPPCRAGGDDRETVVPAPGACAAARERLESPCARPGARFETGAGIAGRIEFRKTYYQFKRSLRWK